MEFLTLKQPKDALGLKSQEFGFTYRYSGLKQLPNRAVLISNRVYH